MERHLDENSADRLLSGSVLPDDAPPGLAPVTALLHDLRAAAPSDPGREAGVVRAMAEALDTAPTRTSPRRGRLVAGAVAGAFLLSSGAAAAAGALPAPAQNAASTVLGSIGVDIPKAEAKAAKRAARAEAKADRDAAKAEAKAAKAGKANDDGTEDGDGADKPANHGQDVSKVAKTTDATGADKGAEVCSVASDDRCQPDKPAASPADKGGPPEGKPAGPPADKGAPDDTGDDASGDDAETDGDGTGDETAGEEG